MDESDHLEAVKEAIAKLADEGCPCGVPRDQPEKLDWIARIAIRRYNSAPRRHRRLDSQGRFLDLVKGLSTPHGLPGGMGHKRDVECVARATIKAITGEDPPDTQTHFV